MRIRLKPIDWEEGYRLERTMSEIERGIQRTLFCYGLDPSEKAISIYQAIQRI